jgi:hypothetical protein
LDDTVGVWTSTNSVDTTITGGTVDFSGTHVWIQRILYTTGGNWVAGTEIVQISGGIDDGGTVSLSYFAADTGNGTHIQGTTITLINPGGVIVGTATTNSSGYISATVQGGNEYTLQAYGPIGYTWPVTDTVTIPTGVTAYTDSMQGYEVPLPAASASVSDVTAYIDVSTGAVVGGTLVPYYQNLLAKLRLVGQSPLRTTTDFAIVPLDYPATPDATGRITFSVPANSVLLPAGFLLRALFQRDGVVIGVESAVHQVYA